MAQTTDTINKSEDKKNRLTRKEIMKNWESLVPKYNNYQILIMLLLDIRDLLEKKNV